MEIIETIAGLIIPALMIYIIIAIPHNIKVHNEYVEDKLEELIKIENELKEEIAKLQNGHNNDPKE